LRRNAINTKSNNTFDARAALPGSVPTMPKLVVSYRRSDSTAIAGRICDRLVARYGNDAVFLDVESIPFATDFRSHIEGSIDQADILLVVIGPGWLGPARSRIQSPDDPVRAEIEMAMRREIPIVPVLIDSATMPEARDLPDSLKKFAFINAAPINSGRDFHPHMERLIRSIDDILDGARSRARPEPPSAAAAAEAPRPTARAVEPERRQLTVMSCDLVGHAALSARMDLEDLRDTIGAYHQCVADTVARFNGVIGRRVGHMVLVHFGYPAAHEDDAVQAVRAGLELCVAVKELKPGGLQCRVGIATGLVIIGDVAATADQGLVGEAPDMAVRLQAVAEPDTVLVAPNARRLVGGFFECRDLGEVQMRGIAAPLHAWQVVGESAVDSRFDALRSSQTPLTGRDEEIELLMRRWRNAVEGEGRVVLISGEAGIGKSRIAVAFEERLRDESHIRLRYSCSPNHSNSALHPFISQLEHAANFRHDDSAATKLDKLEALLMRSSVDLQKDAGLIADLLSIPSGDRYPKLDLSPQKRKEKTLEALLAQVGSLTGKQPVLIIFEDAHWIDPTSLELLELTVPVVASLPVLLVISFRPEFTPRWGGASHVHTLVLNRLNRRNSAEMVSRIAGDKMLPTEVVEQINSRAEGIPLFIEELTKTVLESGLLREEGDRYALSGVLPAQAIPATLHESLMARIDHLAPSRELAQISAAIGREFSYELVAAVAQMREHDLHDALSRLVESELVLCRGVPPNSTYVFKHALVQDAVYGTLLRGRRQALHARIAAVLEGQFAETADVRPEILAHHFAAAGLNEKAAEYFGKAARRSAANSAMAEATAQVTKGLDLVGALPQDQRRWRLEVELLAILGEVLIATKGQAAPETGEAYARARELWSKLGETPHLSAVLYGQFTNCLLGAQMDTAAEIAAEFLRLARQQTDASAEGVALRCVGVSQLHLGKPVAACDHLERSIALDDASLRHSLSYISPANLRVSALGYLAMSQVLCGRRDEGLACVREALDQARRLGRPLAWAATLGITWRVQCLARDSAMLGAQADVLMSVATEQRFPYYLSLGKLYGGYALAVGGQAEEGAARMRDGLATFRATDTRWMIPFFLMLLAEACAAAGRDREGLDHLEEAAATAERTNERWCEAEIIRAKGQLLLALGNEEGAQACFQQALALARSQGATLWELRAARSCARLWSDRGRREEARTLLTPVLRSFMQGLDAPDLRDARALIDELGR
jgi:class 3 adenylate cyclase/predicted ATPase